MCVAASYPYYPACYTWFLLVTCISVALSVLSCVADCHCEPGPIVLIAAVCQHELKCIIIIIIRGILLWSIDTSNNV